MKLVTYAKQGKEQLAFYIDNKLFDTNAANNLLPSTMMEMLNDWEALVNVARSTEADIKAGKIEYRLDKTNIIHCPIGKVSFGTEKLLDNFHTLVDAIVKAKPVAAKGQYLRSVTVASTMGPGVKVNPQRVSE